MPKKATGSVGAAPAPALPKGATGAAGAAPPKLSNRSKKKTSPKKKSAARGKGTDDATEDDGLLSPVAEGEDEDASTATATGGAVTEAVTPSSTSPRASVMRMWGQAVWLPLLYGRLRCRAKRRKLTTATAAAAAPRRLKRRL